MAILINAMHESVGHTPTNLLTHFNSDSLHASIMRWRNSVSIMSAFTCGHLSHTSSVDMAADWQVDVNAVCGDCNERLTQWATHSLERQLQRTSTCQSAATSTDDVCDKWSHVNADMIETELRQRIIDACNESLLKCVKRFVGVCPTDSCIALIRMAINFNTL
ncbi:unnamed protein product [Sphagnum balticum]